MKKGKKILTLFLAVMMLICSVPLSASAGSHTVTITLDISDYLNCWSVYGFWPSGNNYSENASITVSCIDSDGNTTSKKIIVGGSTSDNHTLTFSGISFLNAVKFDFSYLQKTNNLFGLGEITASVKMNNISLGDITINSSNKTVYSSNSFLYNAGGGISSNITLYKAYYVAKFFPSGYDFDEDSYSFSNFSGDISKKYYTTMFGTEKGTELYDYRGSYTGGHCYGMALTTASTFLGAPDATDYIKWNLNFHDNLRSVNKGSNSYTMGISAKDYIKYGHIYQDSLSGVVNRNTNKNNISGLKQAVRDYVNGNGSPVIIDLLGGPGNHTVLAIGINGDDIIVNDSNVTGSPRTIDFNGSSWSYSAAGLSYNNTNTVLSFSTDVITPYLRIVARAYVAGGNVPKDESSELSGEEETYATGMAIVDEDKLLVVDKTNSFSFEESEDLITIDDYAAGNSESANESTLYWLSEGTVINTKNTSNNEATVKLVGDELKISASLPKEATATIEIAENGSNDIKISVEEAEEVNVIFTTVSIDGDLLDTAVSGTADGTEITATQTETGILVTGISDGEVTLIKNEEVIATQAVTDACSDIEITYDSKGESDSIDVDYHGHTYSSAVTVPATCEAEGTLTYTCSCGDSYSEAIPTTEHFYGDDNICDSCGVAKSCSHLCHKSGFMGFIWKILRFFWKLFKINPVCSCGMYHY